MEGPDSKAYDQYLVKLIEESIQSHLKVWLWRNRLGRPTTEVYKLTTLPPEIVDAVHSDLGVYHRVDYLCQIYDHITSVEVLIELVKRMGRSSLSNLEERFRKGILCDPDLSDFSKWKATLEFESSVPTVDYMGLTTPVFASPGRGGG